QDPAFDRAYRVVVDDLGGLPHIRNGAQSGWLRQQATFEAYTTIISHLHALMLVPAAIDGDAELGRTVQALADAARAKEYMAQIRGLLYVAGLAGSASTAELGRIADVRAQYQAAIERFRADATAGQLASWDATVSGQAVRNASRLEQEVLANLRDQVPGVDAQQWWQASTTQLELMRKAEEQILDLAVVAAEARSGDQRRTTQWVTLGSVLLLLVALSTSLLVGRAMVQTLHSLRNQALDVAQRKLPEVIEHLRTTSARSGRLAVDPIAIQSGDEVGEVAEAFTAVHRSAVRLAADQAMMRHNVHAIYVNLARRSQSLVERQLQLLDTLEGSETDPDQLANLFRLDHLATRMRRNDDNLLVLAGGDTTRRWTAPVPLSAVVLAAAAEIEHYTRVRHDITDDIHVVGHAVADLVHLLAELLENATQFSPPETSVTVLGWATEDSAVLTIEDEGMGMSADAVAAANQQVAAPTSIDVAATERMGLVVVGHLARRLGIDVKIRSVSPGVLVNVALPAAILVEPPSEPDAGEPGPTAWLRSERGPTVRATSPDDDSAKPDPGAAAGSAGTGSTALVPVTASMPRRALPTRAEDVLNGQVTSRSSIWWSRTGASTAAAAPPPAPVERPVPEQTSAGLPVRVPMAALPALSSTDGPIAGAAPAGGPATPGPVRLDLAAAPTGAGPASVPGPAGAAGPGRTFAANQVEPDPEATATMLSAFYGGVHRAATEDDGLQAVK
ncbi:MAG TPA: ATP-binding protein, partial [Micromonosporaceae bacterium]